MKRKNPSAMALGRKVGQVRMETMTAKERSKVASRAAKAR